MINSILKVYDEDLARGDLASGTISGTKPICVGTTGGALVVNVFADSDVVINESVSVSVKHGDSKDGGFLEYFSIELEGDGEHKAGELLASTTISEDAKAYMVADVQSSADNSGKIRVTLGYLAR